MNWREEKAAEVAAIIARYPDSRSAIMPLLHFAQDSRGYVDQEDLETIAELLGLSTGYVDSVCSFYSMYKRQPVGRYLITVCTNLSCGLCGADELVRHLENRLGIKSGETTPDGLITLEVTGECLAACDGAPAAQVNTEYVERLTPERADELIASLRAGTAPFEPRAVTVAPGKGAHVLVRRPHHHVDPIDGRPRPVGPELPVQAEPAGSADAGEAGKEVAASRV